jgi:hypothetical protein
MTVRDGLSSQQSVLVPTCVAAVPKRWSCSIQSPTRGAERDASRGRGPGTSRLDTRSRAIYRSRGVTVIDGASTSIQPPMLGRARTSDRWSSVSPEAQLLLAAGKPGPSARDLERAESLIRQPRFSWPDALALAALCRVDAILGNNLESTPGLRAATPESAQSVLAGAATRARLRRALERRSTRPGRETTPTWTS